jgi:DNA repair exonuclease SbcCD ATPase subunit
MSRYPQYISGCFGFTETSRAAGVGEGGTLTEVQRVHDPEIIIDSRPSWEDIKTEWTMGAHRKIEGQLRQARAAAVLETHYGLSSVEAFAKEVKVSPSTVYGYGAAWRRLMLAFGDEAEIYNRLESSPLTITNVLEATRESIEDIPRALDEAEDEGLSTRAQKARRRERQEPQNVEMVREIVCPSCGEISPMNQVEVREIPA